MGMEDHLNKDHFYDLALRVLRVKEPPVATVVPFPAELPNYGVHKRLRDIDVDPLYLAAKKFRRSFFNPPQETPARILLPVAYAELGERREQYYSSTFNKLDDAYLKRDFARFCNGMEELLKKIRLE